jgi:hypothetical protein
MTPEWKFLARTQTGVSHLKAGGSCQDVVRIQTMDSPEGQCLVFCCSDGAGSALYGFDGASLVCEKFMELAHDYCSQCDSLLSGLCRKLGRRWIESIRTELVDKAQMAKLPHQEFSCTLLAGIMSSQRSAFFQIGDGAIVIDEGEFLRVVFWPQTGEYVNSTNFVTDEDSSSLLEFDLFCRINELAVFTDGLERLLLRWDLRQAHEPALRPMLNQLASTPFEGIRDLELSMGLFLKSEAIASRTEDDTSLILATRSFDHVGTS